MIAEFVTKLPILVSFSEATMAVVLRCLSVGRISIQ